VPNDELPGGTAPTPASLLADVERETARVGVDWTAAARAMREVATAAATGGRAGEVGLGVDIAGLLATLRALPAGAGTAVFLEAYRTRRAGVAPPST
jgi:hypothetical protein